MTTTPPLREKDEMGVHLLNLPAELKVVIFGYVFDDAKVKLILPKSLAQAKMNAMPFKTISLLFCCRQLREEALPLFYSHASFRLDEINFADSTITYLPSNIASIRRIHFQGFPSPHYRGRSWVKDLTWQPQLYTTNSLQACPLLQEFTFDLVDPRFLSPKMISWCLTAYHESTSVKVNICVDTAVDSARSGWTSWITMVLPFKFTILPGNRIVLHSWVAPSATYRAQSDWTSAFHSVLRQLQLCHENVKVINRKVRPDRKVRPSIKPCTGKLCHV